VMDDMRFVMVPKRCFADRGMEQAFRALIGAKISEGYFLEQEKDAVPVVNAVTLPPPPLGGR